MSDFSINQILAKALRDNPFLGGFTPGDVASAFGSAVDYGKEGWSKGKAFAEELRKVKAEEAPAIAKAVASGVAGATAGVPADFAVNAANLIRAAAGYGGHKLGLLDASQMPREIDPADMPGTSKWISNRMGVGNTPGEVAGEFVGGMFAPGPRALKAPNRLEAAGEPTVKLRPGNERYNNLGIYDDPRKIVEDSAKNVVDESPLLKELFNTSRQALDERALQKQDPNISSSFLYIPTRPPIHTQEIMVPGNERRLQDIVFETAQHPRFAGSAGWYETDPMLQDAIRVLGPELGRKVYLEHHRFTSPMSVLSTVDKEVNKGTLAHLLHAARRSDEFYPKENMPAGIGGLAHSSSHSAGFRNLVNSQGERFWNPLDPPQKTGPYYHTKTGQNYELPVGDSHWGRGVALPDVRKWVKNQKGILVPDDSSIGKTEAGILLPWYHKKVAEPLGLTGGVAQPLQWGGMSSRTNVESAIGAPLAEITAVQVAKSAKRQGISPREALDNYWRAAAGLIPADPFKRYLGLLGGASVLGGGVLSDAVLDEEQF